MARTDRPNVIVFLTDQQRWDSTGAHGNPLSLTPNFDDVAASGTHIAYSITCQPVCAPARGCLQTGRYATNHGVFRNAIALPPQEKTLAHYFQDAGYTTGYIGKWHLANAEPVPEAQRGGYQYWLGANAIELVSDGYDTIVYDCDPGSGRAPRPTPGHPQGSSTLNEHTLHTLAARRLHFRLRQGTGSGHR
jgi:arylsulfatase A-like enzyme